MHSKLIFTIFVVIFLFELKTLNAEDPPSFSIYCMDKKTELKNLVNKEAKKVPDTSFVLKSDFGEYIFKKIDFLDKMAEQFVLEHKSHFEDNSVQLLANFVNYLRKEKSAIDENKIKNWVNKFLVGRINLGPFLDVLEGIEMLRFQNSLSDKENETKGVKFKELKELIDEFIHKLKIELIYGQTHKDFNDMKERLVENEGKINDKIKEADAILNMKESKGDKMPSKLRETMQIKGKKQQAEIDFENQRGYMPKEYRELYLKYKKLNDASLELYTDLGIIIPEMIDERKTNNKISFAWETVLRANIFKNAFDQVISVSNTTPYMQSHFTPRVPKQQNENRDANGYYMGQPSDIPAGFFVGRPARLHHSPIKGKPQDYVDPEEAANRELDDPTILHSIVYNLSLSEDWIKKEGKLITGKKSKGIVIRAALRLDAGHILMAFERMQKCF